MVRAGQVALQRHVRLARTLGLRALRRITVGDPHRIEQPRLPKLVWVVTAVDPGASWTWRQRSPGGTTEATHWVEPLGDGRTRVRQRIEQRGPIGALVGRLMHRTTVRYLAIEGEGLKARSEERVRAGGPSA